LQSSESWIFLTRVAPFAIAPAITALCEMDLSPGIVIVPLSLLIGFIFIFLFLF